MSRIKKLVYYNKKNAHNIVSFLNDSVMEEYINRFAFNPLSILHYLLPLKYKFLPESYILEDKKEVKGLLTIVPLKSSLKKFEIQQLCFEENNYDAAQELIQFVVSKYKARGASSFLVKIDDYLPDLLRVFVAKSGFTQISYEKLWKVKIAKFDEAYDLNIRLFRNSDVKAVLGLHNESILPHFRYFLEKEENEFKETLFKGLDYKTEYRYVVEDKKSKAIIAYISIQTNDNKNFIIDYVQASWADIDFNTIFTFARKQIRKRNKKFNMFVRTKRYTQMGEKIEKCFLEHRFECVQNKIVLTNSSAKIINEPVKTGKYTVVGQFYRSSKEVGANKSSLIN